MTLYGAAGIVNQGLNTVTTQFLSMLCCPVSQSPHGAASSMGFTWLPDSQKVGLAGGLLISERGGEANFQAWGLH